MNSDSAYFIAGKGHDVCQDYAVHGVQTDGRCYAIVSDGCSLSAKTDVGSRLLTECCIRLLGEFPQGSLREVVERVGSSVNLAASVLGLPKESLDATLLVVNVGCDGIRILAAGDGVIAIGHDDGIVSLEEISFPSGYPAYLSYTFCDDRMAAYREVSQNERLVKSSLLTLDGDVYEERIIGCPTDEVWVLERSLSASGVRFVALFSDGVHSFLAPGDSAGVWQPVKAAEVIRELLAFKTIAGRFVLRRAKRFLEQARECGWKYTDDLSVAAVIFD